MSIKMSGVDSDLYRQITAEGEAFDLSGYSRVITLPQWGLQRLEGDSVGAVVQCLSGRLWVTQVDDFDDYFLEAGEAFVVTQPGLVLVEARRDSSFRIASRKYLPLLQYNTN